MPQSDFQKRKRKATTIRMWSQENTQFPLAYKEVVKHFAEVVKHFAHVNVSRVIAFDFKVWLEPHKNEKGK